MKEYVEFFVKLKIMNNKHYTPKSVGKSTERIRPWGWTFISGLAILQRTLE
jgi:hypothetical protein